MTLPFRHPAQLVVVGFAAAITIGTVLLVLPIARAGPGGAGFVDALFTATSAVCVTGLTVVDTPTYWSGFGEAVILGLIQIGGFGIMTMASVLGLLISRRLGLRSRLAAAAETRSLGLGDVGSVVVGVAKISIVFEVMTAAILSSRFAIGYDEELPRAIYLGLFHAVSAFNNAGFALYSDNLMRFVSDPWICLPIAIAVIVGGLGFPVVIELRRQFRRPKRWSLHTRLTVGTTVVLLVLGTGFMLANEWSNDGTLGPLGVPAKLLAGFFAAVMPRTAGFNSLDVTEMSAATWLGTDVLMFIGGGSGGTAGGIKVTTFAVLLYVVWAEVRGERDVNVVDRRLSDRTVRQALTIGMLSISAVVVSTLILLELTSMRLDQVLLEVVSALATVGLSAGITADLPTAAHVVLTLLMFVGRLGPVTLATALALRSRERLYELPEGRPIIG